MGYYWQYKTWKKTSSFCLAIDFVLLSIASTINLPFNLLQKNNNLIDTIILMAERIKVFFCLSCFGRIFHQIVQFFIHVKACSALNYVNVLLRDYPGLKIKFSNSWNIKTDFLAFHFVLFIPSQILTCDLDLDISEI